ncbi:MAG: glycosyltransferase [Betaproteobacteria bacterium]|nr:glycosyltransferase [Betaproteobacteria bacterium]
MSLSVLILSFNHAPYIRDAIASVIHQLSYVDDIELLILDDGSTDGTQDILRTLSVPQGVTLRLFLEEHRGVYAITKNLNFLIKQSTKEYIAFLSSDDFFSEDAFNAQIDYLNATPDCQFVYGNGVNFSNDQLLNRLHIGRLRESLEHGDPLEIDKIITSTVPQLYIQALLVRRSFFDGFAPFDESLIADDWAFNIRIFRRLAERCQCFFFIDTIVFHRRVLDTSASRDLKAHYHRVLQVARKYVPADSSVFYSRFYVRCVRVFVKNRMFKRATSMLVRLIALKLGFHRHSVGLEQII